MKIMLNNSSRRCHVISRSQYNEAITKHIAYHDFRINMLREQIKFLEDKKDKNKAEYDALIEMKNAVSALKDAKLNYVLDNIEYEPEYHDSVEYDV